MNDDQRRGFKRDLPAPPKRSADNYLSCLAELYRQLDEAEMVAPLPGDREWVEETRERVREELMERLDAKEAAKDAVESENE